MVVVAASVRLPTRCVGVACRTLDSQRVRPCGLREASRLTPGNCLATHFALRLAETNVPPGFTLMHDVRDVPALPNKFRAAMVTSQPFRLTLTDPPGDSPGSGRDKVGN